MSGLLRRFNPFRSRIPSGVAPSQRESMVRSYITALRARYPLADPPSLIAAFLILHEATAIVPLFAGFIALGQLGVGEKLVEYATREADELNVEPDQGSWGRAKVRKWIKEGDEQAERIGRRYGVLGYEKESSSDRAARKAGEASSTSIILGGDVANLVAAYIAVKVGQSAFLSENANPQPRSLTPPCRRCYPCGCWSQRDYHRS